MCPRMQLWMHETYSLTCCPGGVITALTDAGARPLPLRSAPMPAHRHAVASRRASTHRTPAVFRVGADTGEAPGTDTDEARRNVTRRHGLNYCLQRHGSNGGEVACGGEVAERAPQQPWSGSLVPLRCAHHLSRGLPYCAITPAVLASHLQWRVTHQPYGASAPLMATWETSTRHSSRRR